MANDSSTNSGPLIRSFQLLARSKCCSSKWLKCYCYCSVYQSQTINKYFLECSFPFSLDFHIISKHYPAASMPCSWIKFVLCNQAQQHLVHSFYLHTKWRPKRPKKKNNGCPKKIIAKPFKTMREKKCGERTWRQYHDYQQKHKFIQFSSKIMRHSKLQRSRLLLDAFPCFCCFFLFFFLLSLWVGSSDHFKVLSIFPFHHLGQWNQHKTYYNISVNIHIQYSIKIICWCFFFLSVFTLERFFFSSGRHMLIRYCREIVSNTCNDSH